MESGTIHKKYDCFWIGWGRKIEVDPIEFFLCSVGLNEMRRSVQENVLGNKTKGLLRSRKTEVLQI